GGYPPRLERRAVCHPVQPVGDHLFWDDGGSLADEDEEGRLESIFGVVMITEDTTADAPDHRPMPPHQGCKSRFLTAVEVVLQQLPIGPLRPISQQHSP